MTRGTTPIIRIIIEDIYMEDVSELICTIYQNEKRQLDIYPTVDSDGIINVELAQQDTLIFKKGTAKIQLRGLLNDDTAFATEIKVIDINDILKDGII